MGDVLSHDNDAAGGVFLLTRDGRRIGEMTYRRLGDSRILVDHTEVDPAQRGQGVARQLLDGLATWARQTGTKVSATCSYVVVQFARDKSLADLQG
jgi:hypothetical protein